MEEGKVGLKRGHILYTATWRTKGDTITVTTRIGQKRVPLGSLALAPKALAVSLLKELVIEHVRKASAHLTNPNAQVKPPAKSPR